MYYSLSDEQSKRINILKLLLTLFVVSLHSLDETFTMQNAAIMQTPQWLYIIKYLFSKIIPSCCNNGFFLISSILLYRKEFVWKDNLKKKTQTLLIPYLIMNSLWIIVFWVCQSLPYLNGFLTNKEYLINEFGVCDWLGAYGIGSDKPILHPMWFIRDLYIFHVLSKVIKTIIDKFPKISFIVIACLYLFLPSTNCAYLRIDALCFWCFGYYIVKYKCDINYFDKKKYVPIAYIGVIIVSVLLIGKCFYIRTVLISRIRDLISIIFWYGCFTFQSNRPVQKLLSKYSKYSFGIYLFHDYLLLITIRAVYMIFGKGLGVQIANYLLVPPLICCVVILFCSCFEKVAPRMYNLLMGGRVK